MIIIKNLTKEYNTGAGKILALDNVNLELKDDTFYIVLGASGSGKSTLLNLIGGVDEITDGEICFDGKNISGMREKEKANYRNSTIGFVFQNFQLIPTLSVYENIILPVMIARKEVDVAYVEELISLLGIADKRNVYPAQLSGGQMQRVAIARAFVNKPDIILADEPTGSLDSKNGKIVVELIQKMQEQYHQTVLMITHNENLVEYADEVIRIKDGKIQ